MAAVSLTCSPSVALSYTPSSGPLSGQQLTPTEAFACVLRVAGVAADQIDNFYYGILTMVASTPQTLDVTALTDLLGNAITAARARFVAFKWYSTTDNVPALVGGAASNEWDGFLSSGGKVSVFPSTSTNSGWLILSAPQTTGIPINSGSKSLKIDPQAAAGRFDVIIGTCSS